MIASVPSHSFEGLGHSVVMDINGLVVHDPNPNKAWEGINVLGTGDLKSWMMIGEKEGNKIKKSPTTIGGNP